MIVLRGAIRIVATATGLLLLYAIDSALEGMTTRIPTAAAWELATSTLWTAPWMLLWFSGFEDLGTVVRKDLVLWIGVVAALLFLYYLDWNTSLSLLTKALMPPLAVFAGLMPHFVKRIRFLFVMASVAAGVVGVLALYHVANMFLYTTTYFVTKLIGLVIVTFGVASTLSGLLAMFDMSRSLTLRASR